MKLYDVSQLPVMDGDDIVGIVDESDVLLHVYGDEARFRDPVSTAMVSKLDKLDVTSPIESLLPVFDRGHVAIVIDGDKFLGLITRIDLLELPAPPGAVMAGASIERLLPGDRIPDIRLHAEAGHSRTLHAHFAGTPLWLVRVSSADAAASLPMAPAGVTAICVAEVLHACVPQGWHALRTDPRWLELVEPDRLWRGRCQPATAGRVPSARPPRCGRGARRGGPGREYPGRCAGAPDPGRIRAGPVPGDHPPPRSRLRRR